MRIDNNDWGEYSRLEERSMCRGSRVEGLRGFIARNHEVPGYIDYSLNEAEEEFLDSLSDVEKFIEWQLEEPDNAFIADDLSAETLNGMPIGEYDSLLRPVVEEEVDEDGLPVFRLDAALFDGHTPDEAYISDDRI